MDKKELLSSYVQIRVTEEEHEAIKQLGKDRQIQTIGRRMLQEGVAKRLGGIAKPHGEWHEKLDFILSHGDQDDIIGIQRNLDWAASDIRNRPKRKRAGR